MGSQRIVQNLRIVMCGTGWRDLLVASSGALVCTATNAFLTGGIGPFGRMVGLDETAAGLILGAGSLAAVVAAPTFGYASERWGRRKMMLLAMLPLIAGAFIMAALFAKPEMAAGPTLLVSLVLARALQTGGGTGMIPLTQALAADKTTQDQRARGMAIVGAALSAGTVAGSLLLWATGRLGAEIGLAALSAGGLVSLIGIATCLSDPPRSASLQIPAPTLRCLRRTWPYLGVTFLGLTAYLTVVPVIGLRLIDALGFEPGGAASTAGIVMTLSSAAMVLSQAQVALFGARRFGMILTLGCVAGGVALGSLALAGSLPALVLAMGCTGVFLGQVAPVNHAALSLAAPPDSQGRVAGLNSFLRSLAMVIGPLLGFSLYQAGPHLPFVVAMLCLFIAALLPFARYPLHALT